MDRDEYPVAVHTAEPTARAGTPEGQALELMDRDPFEPAAFDPRESPQPLQFDETPAAADQITSDQVIEALLFSSDTPLSAARLAELAGDGSTRNVTRRIAALNEKYAAAGLSFRIEEIARGYQMMTLPAYRPWLEKLNHQRTQTRLSPAALETLAIIAYKQPTTRADIESIRGVACGEVLNRLREMGLVRIVGRAEIVGRPMLYGTTRRFLDIFGLADLDELPPMEALSLRAANRAAQDNEPGALAEDPPEPRVAVGGA